MDSEFSAFSARLNRGERSNKYSRNKHQRVKVPGTTKATSEQEASTSITIMCDLFYKELFHREHGKIPSSSPQRQKQIPIYRSQEAKRNSIQRLPQDSVILDSSINY